MEEFEKFKSELIDELDYVMMKMKQVRSKRLPFSNESEEEKRSGSLHSNEDCMKQEGDNEERREEGILEKEEERVGGGRLKEE